MLFKLDENLPPSARLLFQEEGHDAQTVEQEGLKGILDPDLYEVVKKEGRILVSLDLDFSDIRHYPPREGPGIVILRLNRQDKFRIKTVLRNFLVLIRTEEVSKRLWILSENSFRVRGEDDSEE